jgi:hypothetical protein
MFYFMRNSMIIIIFLGHRKTTKWSTKTDFRLNFLLRDNQELEYMSHNVI